MTPEREYVSKEQLIDNLDQVCARGGIWEKALTDWIKSQPGIVLTKEERRHQLIQSIAYLVAAGVVLAAIVIYMYNIAHYGH